MYHLLLIIFLVVFFQFPVLAEDKYPLLDDLEKYQKVEIPLSRQGLTLEDSLIIGLKNHPQLQVSISAIEASKGQVLQSSLYVNPKIGLSIEDAFGFQSLSGISGAEFTLQASQQILLGGKFENRKKLAKSNLNLLESSNKVLILNLFREIKINYINLLVAQEYLSLTKQLLSVSEEMLNTIKKKVEAGKISPIEVKRANIIYTTSEIEYKKALLESEQLGKALAVTIGFDSVNSIKVKGNVFNLKPIPELSSLIKKLFQSVDIDNWDKKIAVQENIIAMAKSNAVQNLTINSGFRYLNGEQDFGLVLGLSYPVPIFNKNIGNINTAKSNLQKTIKSREAFIRNLKLQIIQSHLQLSKMYTELKSLKNIVIPEAEETFHAINKGYQYGKFDYLDVLDTQRTLFTFKSTYINRLKDYQKSTVNLERFIGESIILLKQDIKGDK